MLKQALNIVFISIMHKNMSVGNASSDLSLMQMYVAANTSQLQQAFQNLR